MGSEAVLIYDITQGHSVALLLVVATIGNTLGSCVNYYLGLKGEEYLEQKGHLKAERIKRYQNYFDRFGGFTLLFSWLPLVGDPITFIAGVLKYDFKRFFLIVLVAKFLRYAFLAYITLM